MPPDIPEAGIPSVSPSKRRRRTASDSGDIARSASQLATGRVAPIAGHLPEGHSTSRRTLDDMQQQRLALPAPHASQQRQGHEHQQQQIYVLSADGSKLFLLDASVPTPNEEPPAYHTIQSPRSGRCGHTRQASAGSSRIRQALHPSEHGLEEGLIGRDGENGSDGAARHGLALGLDTESWADSGRDDMIEGPGVGPSTQDQGTLPIGHSRVHTRTTSIPSSIRTTPHRSHGCAASEYHSPLSDADMAEHIHRSPTARHTLRASMTSSVRGEARTTTPGRRAASISASMRGSRPRLQHSQSSPPTPSHLRNRGAEYGRDGGVEYEGAGEGTPLLGVVAQRHRRGLLRAVVCGEEMDPAGPRGRENSWKAAWRRYWRPLSDGMYWKSLLHLLVLNFPLALAVWPFLVAGSVAGTALLVTLPLGAVVWWITLILARSAARLEIVLQGRYHPPILPSEDMLPVIRPRAIFYRPAVFQRQQLDAESQLEGGYTGRNRSPSPHYGSITSPSSPRGHFGTSHGATPPSDDRPMYTGNEAEPGWEKGFLKCSYEMFCDHYSYSALVYFLLIKPLTTLFPTIALVALFPAALATVGLMPVYMRAARRWGVWQAGVARNNLLA